MQTRLALASLCIFLSGSLCAAEGIGRLTCAGPVKLAGTVLPVDDIPFWTIVRGDEIEALAEQAFLLLRDGTRIVLEKQSVLSVSSAGNTLHVRLLKGDLSYRLEASGTTLFFDGERPLAALGASEATLRAGAGRVDPPKGSPETRPPPRGKPRSGSAPGQNK